MQERTSGRIVHDCPLIEQLASTAHYYSLVFLYDLPSCRAHLAMAVRDALYGSRIRSRKDLIKPENNKL